MTGMSQEPGSQLRVDPSLQNPVSSAERANAEQQLDLDTNFALQGFDRASIEQRVVGAVAEKITAEVTKPSFIKRALSFIGQKIWEGLNTKVGKVIGGIALGLFAFRFGGMLGQPLAGGLLGAAITAGGATNIFERAPKLNPYHLAIGSITGITAVAITSPLFLGLVGWGIAAAALPAAVFIAGRKKLWVPNDSLEK